MDATARVLGRLRRRRIHVDEKRLRRRRGRRGWRFGRRRLALREGGGALVAVAGSGAGSAVAGVTSCGSDAVLRDATVAAMNPATTATAMIAAHARWRGRSRV
jgi:hypothetical protein